MKSHPSFAEAARKYRVIFFDAYGVLKNFHGIIEGVPEAIINLSRNGVDSFVITNDASKSPGMMAEQYTHPSLGSLFSVDRIISSGMLASEFIQAKVRSGKIAYLGKPASAYYIEVAGCDPIPLAQIEDPEEIKALVLMDDEGFDWFSDINRTVNFLRKMNIPVVVANTDIAYPVKSNDVAIAIGSLANMIEAAIGKTFIRFGKPDSQIFSFAYARALQKYPDIQKNEILMVGDTLQTDILGDNKFGIDSALVLSGNTQKEKA
ncbi:MAG: HAD-IIA family hydrolase, partial [Leptospiraceae bacterium]|nr:HAD-IIA family hydrolase [Leptospiraceae bacterium]